MRGIDLLSAIGVAFIVVSFHLSAQEMGKMNSFHIRSPQELHAFFHFTGNDIPVISGHRGGTAKGFPENSIEAFENTLRFTPAFFEVDPRLTKDGVIVLMHDETLDRTTTGKGKVSDYTWAQLQELRLKDSAGTVTPFKIPTLDAAIEWSKGKTILNLDKKDVPLEMTAQKLREHEADDRVMLTVHNAAEAKFYYEDNKNRMFSAFIKNRKELETYEKAGIPWAQIMAYIGSTNKPENKEMYNLLHARGVMCMVSTAPSYDKLADSEARRDAYIQFIKSGADVIESDRPIEVADAIQPLIPMQSSKQQFFDRARGQ